MKKELIDKITLYVQENISNFHKSRLEKLNNLKLETVLKKKNPYLFKAKNIQTAAEIVKNITDAFLSSAEETMFGDWLEGLAIYVNTLVYNGKKSSAEGIDLEFDKDDVRYIVSIKSGPNWGNSGQVKKMKEDFIKAKRILRTGKSKLNIVAVNGCCYGRDNNPDKGDYFKYCGQDFWCFISDEPNLYTDIIEPLSTDAKENNDEFQRMYSKLLNVFTQKFIADYCMEDGSIDWQKLVKFNSGSSSFNNA